MDHSPPGSPVHAIFQAKIWEWVAISFSRRSSCPRDWTLISCTGGRIHDRWATREALLHSLAYNKSQFLYSPPFLFSSMDKYWNCGASILTTDCCPIPRLWHFHFTWFRWSKTKSGNIQRVPPGWTIKETLVHIHTSDHYPHRPHRDAVK